MTDEEAKRQAAVAALAYLPDSGVVGLGTGSTSDYFTREVAKLCQQGRKLVGVPTSKRTRALAESLGIPLLGDEGPWSIDVCVDGADEVSPNFDLIKGGGASHTREKIVNAAARFNVILVDESKLSNTLGTRCPLPVEVLQFGHASTQSHLERWGRPVLRKKGEQVVCTDSGNFVYDLHGQIKDPCELNTRVACIPGVVETGLFLGRANVVLVGSPNGCRELARP
ncbi:MAG TPA: ribose-5-phosphate isomerase RpiA [Polyangiaceae bacterium]|nr:ribose-5-phosphate isomerase RpiA [Polyangiaceae bacterium]